MTRTHWMIVAMVLGGLALQLSGIEHWAEASSPQFVAGLLASLAATVTAMFTEKPSR